MTEHKEDGSCCKNKTDERTEGIIQKAFKKTIDAHRYNVRINDFVPIAKLEALQQELIAEIKKQSRGYFDSYEKVVTLQDLIGNGEKKE